MLSELKIENVAVIEKAQVHFDQGFNVLTGETGAGKSILIDSIQAIMGSRVSRDLVRTGARKACIWATFEQIPERVKRQLEKAGYEAEDSLLLYREISAEGKSSCRLNGMPVTAAVVRDICKYLDGKDEKALKQAAWEKKASLLLAITENYEMSIANKMRLAADRIQLKLLPEMKKIQEQAKSL